MCAFSVENAAVTGHRVNSNCVGILLFCENCSIHIDRVNIDRVKDCSEKQAGRSNGQEKNRA
ncbi:MAG TPA: hypothetical protein DDY31_03655 [Lachnospiraceae bacterium]|nr:hypothetical protein [Lachnospiraceae bacterium]